MLKVKAKLISYSLNYSIIIYSVVKYKIAKLLYTNVKELESRAYYTSNSSTRVLPIKCKKT
jgi:hypothetical protein